MDKGLILREIRRVAEAQGKAPGRQAFERETGIGQRDWYPHLWIRWGEALTEAGLQPNQLQSKLDDSLLFRKYISLIRELGRLPVHGELRRKAQADGAFPSHTVFERFGGKGKLIAAVEAFCRGNPGYDDVLQLCAKYTKPAAANRSRTREKVATGCVYLMKSGRHYKVGRTNALGRRERDLAIKVPVPPRTIHSIETDDPVGVEAYWHKRFAEKRGEGEWFDLSPDDVAAFKRWRRIV